ncbi:MAG TPA: folylpolyglutamate synthase/dihydrofolate synthase family protein [Sediminibacterium sp.]|jgi:dihydrofolate synthase/folylpolyglutamate synthase|nr:folylpolyglutamate synthase/dihydrofolate synthase family protein [Sediminibacterium sp.]HQS54129.1 folylpolyglutamate synthase/dihydrofolate synthase family protein [Sediminibacterium sp.]
MKTYAQTLDYLFRALPMFSKLGESAYKKDLHNTLALCAFLGNPQHKFKTIHVAGTNGKGSTSHMLAAIFQSAGYKTGLYTSPHLKDFRERIKVNGQVCSEEYVVSFTHGIEPLIQEISPSFFEITVAMAFDYFAQQQVDIAIIEVGLGGRLDSTNIIDPELSIITNIGFDHMNLLGNRLEEIAFEKAGIIKPEKPVVIGESLPETKPVFLAKAASCQAPIHFAKDHFQIIDFESKSGHLLVKVSKLFNQDQLVYELDLPGYYQTKNLLTVLTSVELLIQQGWNLNWQLVAKALKQVKKLSGLHGRWEVISDDPLTVLDVGHNEDGIKEIVKQIELTAKQSLHIVIGMVKDKEIDKALQLLPKHATYYFTKAAIPRALSESLLQQQAASFGLIGNAYPTVIAAFTTAKQHASKDDLILVCGSVFVVAEVI